MEPTDRPPGSHAEPPPDLAERQLPLTDASGPWFRVHRASTWSAALHAHPAAAHGILYRARHDPEQLSIAVWERAADHLTAERLGSLAAPQHARILGEILDRYRFGLATS